VTAEDLASDGELLMKAIDDVIDLLKPSPYYLQPAEKYYDEPIEKIYDQGY